MRSLLPKLKDSNKTWTYYGAEPGRLGFPEGSQGHWVRASGILVPRRPTAFPFGFVTQKAKNVTQWWPPPDSWIANRRSAFEWPPFHALELILGEEGILWVYQVPEGGGRSRSFGAVIDFVIYDREPPLAVRIQTERYHIASLTKVHQRDEAQRQRLIANGYQVIDIFDSDFMPSKESGRGIMYWMRRALAGQQNVSPILGFSRGARR